MKRLTKQEKMIDNQINESFKRHGYGVQIPIMKIPEIFKACNDAISHGLDLDVVMVQQLTIYRVN